MELFIDFKFFVGNIRSGIDTSTKSESQYRLFMLQLRRLCVPLERRIIDTKRCRQIIRAIQTVPKRGDKGTLYDLLASKMITYCVHKSS